VLELAIATAGQLDVGKEILSVGILQRHDSLDLVHSYIVFSDGLSAGLPTRYHKVQDEIEGPDGVQCEHIHLVNVIRLK